MDLTPVSAIMIAYENEQLSLTRLHRDLLPALAGLDAELIVIDNSREPLLRLWNAVVDAALPSRYQFCGTNLLYGPALNRACKLARHPYVLYVCTNHGEARDPSWAADLLAPLLADDTVAMTGTLWPSGDPAAVGYPVTLPHHHIQGGVFAARRQHLLTYPYPDGQYAHYGADLVMCFQLMAAGLRLVEVPTVRSTWQHHPGAGGWKYLHVGGVPPV